MKNVIYIVLLAFLGLVACEQSDLTHESVEPTLEISYEQNPDNLYLETYSGLLMPRTIGIHTLGDYEVSDSLDQVIKDLIIDIRGDIEYIYDSTHISPYTGWVHVSNFTIKEYNKHKSFRFDAPTDCGVNIKNAMKYGTIVQLYRDGEWRTYVLDFYFYRFDGYRFMDLKKPYCEEYNACDYDYDHKWVDMSLYDILYKFSQCEMRIVGFNKKA